MTFFTNEITLSIEGCDYIASLYDDIYRFKNIPYAKLKGNPKEGLHIFGLPMDIEPEEGKDLWPEKPRSTVNTLEAGPISLQTTRSRNVHMSAQCQNFNIWIPREIFDKKENAPVLFYVHGGSFKSGSNQHPALDGANLARDLNIIVIEPNYRLGPLGFIDFSHMDNQCGENMAIHDLLSALRWVQRHIAAFGGDPDNVTLMGESSGGAIISVFPFLEEAQGMFSKLVILSGIPGAFTYPEAEDKRAEQFLKFVGVEDIRELYQLKMWDKIAEAVNPFTKAIHMGVAAYIPFTNGKAFLPDNAVSLMKEAVLSGKTLDIPIWANVAEDELSFMAVMPEVFGRWGMGDMMDEALLEEGDYRIGNLNKIYRDAYGEKHAQTQTYSDMVIRSTIWYMQFAAQCTETYFTRLAWKSPMQKATKLGTFHSSELYIIFNNYNARTGRTSLKALALKTPAETKCPNILNRISDALCEEIRDGRRKIQSL